MSFFLKKKKIKLKYLIPGFIFILILLPHLIWLVDNDFTTITYALHRATIQEVDFFKAHLLYPLMQSYH